MKEQDQNQDEYKDGDQDKKQKMQKDQKQNIGRNKIRKLEKVGAELITGSGEAGAGTEAGTAAGVGSEVGPRAVAGVPCNFRRDA